MGYGRQVVSVCSECEHSIAATRSNAASSAGTAAEPGCRFCFRGGVLCYVASLLSCRSASATRRAYGVRKCLPSSLPSAYPSSRAAELGNSLGYIMPGLPALWCRRIYCIDASARIHWRHHRRHCRSHQRELAGLHKPGLPALWCRRIYCIDASARIHSGTR
jgi:hypothetical protein